HEKCTRSPAGCALERPGWARPGVGEGRWGRLATCLMQEAGWRPTPLHTRRAKRRFAMRKVIFGVANSLDNFIARPDHAVDWLLWGKEAAAFMSQFWKTIDTVLWGR